MTEAFIFICILAVLLLAYKERERLRKVKLGKFLEIEFEKVVVDQNKNERKPRLQPSTFSHPTKRKVR